MIELFLENIVQVTANQVASVNWNVSATKDFSGTLIYQGTTTYNGSVTFNYDFVNTRYIYAKARLTFTNGTFIDSDVITLSDDCKVQAMGARCWAGEITVDQFTPNSAYGSKMRCTLSDPRFFMGNVAWVATSWRVLDVGGNVVWARERDTENLKSITLTTANFGQLKLATVEAEYIFDQAGVSTPKSLVFVVLDNDDYGFGIDHNRVNADLSVNLIGVINTEYVLNSVTWRTINSTYDIIESGTGTISLDGANYIDYNYVKLIITLDTKFNGLKRGEFIIWVDKELTVLPQPLPLPVTP